MQFPEFQTGARKDVLDLIHDIAEDLMSTHGRENAIALTRERRATVPRFYQRANWRMIERLIEDPQS
jgi:hypothetical protein